MFKQITKTKTYNWPDSYIIDTWPILLVNKSENINYVNHDQ